MKIRWLNIGRVWWLRQYLAIQFINFFPGLTLRNMVLLYCNREYHFFSANNNWSLFNLILIHSILLFTVKVCFTVSIVHSKWLKKKNGIGRKKLNICFKMDESTGLKRQGTKKSGLKWLKRNDIDLKIALYLFS